MSVLFLKIFILMIFENFMIMKMRIRIWILKNLLNLHLRLDKSCEKSFNLSNRIEQIVMLFARGCFVMDYMDEL